MKLETHVHTKYSKDSLLCFWPLYLKCLVLKIEYIAITEHNNVYGGIEFRKFCEKHGNKVHVIVGEEILTNAGEIIGLYLKENIEHGLSPKETINEILKQGGIVYVPHPFDTNRQRTVLLEKEIEKNREYIDCIEIHNGRNMSSIYDIEQKKIAIKYGITAVIGSDAHTWIEIGRNYMKVDKAPITPGDFKNVVLKAEFKSKRSNMIVHQITKIVKIIKLIRMGNISELYRIIIRKLEKSKH